MTTTTSTSTPVRGGDLAPVPLHRLYLLRVGYAFMGLGLVVTKWPLMVSPPESWSVAQSVVDTMLVALSVLALLGLRHPLRMLPVLLFESLWKLLWLGVVALPAARAGDMSAAMSDVVLACALVAVVLAVVPWGYVRKQYVTAQGDRWR
jgi:mannose/fructose/N-acetylgalactosamine-specific phosphotransferase system component IIC